MADPLNQVTPYIGLAQNLLGRVLGFTQQPTNVVSQSNLNNLSQVINKHGISRTNRFIVIISIPKVLSGTSFAEHQRTLTFLCEGTSLPGVALATDEQKRFGMGPTEKRPYAPIFNDVLLQFYGDGQGLIHKYFYLWLNNIVRFDMANTRDNVDSRSTSKLAPFRVQYKDNYKCNITIITYNEKNESVIEVKLNDAFPVSIPDIPLSWGDNDQFMRIPVTFHYWTWSMNEYLSKDLSRIKLKPELNILEKIFKVGSAVQVIRSIKKPESIGDIINVVNNTRVVLENSGLFAQDPRGIVNIYVPPTPK